MTENIKRYTIEELRKMKSLSSKLRIQYTSEQEILDQIENDPDLYNLTESELSEFKLAAKRRTKS